MRKASSATEPPAHEFAAPDAGGPDGLTELRLLRRATTLVLSPAPVDEVLTELMTLLTAAAGARGAGIAFRAPTGELVPGLHLGLPPESMQVGSGVCERAIEGGAPVAVADIASDPLFERVREQVLALGIVAVVAAPIVASDGTCLGALALHLGRPPAAEDLERSRTYAGLAAVILEHKRAEASGQRRAEDATAAAAADRRKQEYLAIVSHDLRNPLSAILTSATLLQLGEQRAGASDQADRARRQTDVIIRSVRHMDRLISDLLDLSQIESGRLRLRRQRRAVPELVREAVEGIQAQAHGKHLTIAVEVDPEVPCLSCDGERLLQVLGNLLGNAVKFTPEGGALRVGATLRGDAVEFVVEDSGIGITGEYLERIFDRYWQAQRRARQGVGLGLSIARGIVEGHGGHIRVESTAGVGTRFYFTIPLHCSGRRVELLADLAQVFDLPVAAVEALWAASEREQAWEPGPGPGLGLMPITCGPRHRGASGFLVRIAAGATYPYHRHATDEHVLILEGGLRDDDGTELWEGERTVHPAGTAHASTAIGGVTCMLAAVATGACA